MAIPRKHDVWVLRHQHNGDASRTVQRSQLAANMNASVAPATHPHMVTTYSKGESHLSFKSYNRHQHLCWLPPALMKSHTLLFTKIEIKSDHWVLPATYPILHKLYPHCIVPGNRLIHDRIEGWINQLTALETYIHTGSKALQRPSVNGTFRPLTCKMEHETINAHRALKNYKPQWQQLSWNFS